MKLIDRLPTLPDGQGKLWTHETDNEHSTKFVGAEHELNPLRTMCLERVDGHEIDEISGDRLFNLMIERSSDFRLVDRRGATDPNAPTGLIGASIADFDTSEPHQKVVAVRELIVHPELRGMRIASFMLGAFANCYEYGSPTATEMYIDSSTYKISPEFIQKLVGAGFNHEDSAGNPSIWLPGTGANAQIRPNVRNAREKIIGAMPENWTGHLGLSTEERVETQLYRRAKLVGSLITTGEGSWNSEVEDFLQDFIVLDAGQVELGLLQQKTHNEALIDALNNYSLVD